MRTAIDFLKEGQIIEGSFKIGKEKFDLGIQPDGSVCFKEPDDKTIYNGFMMNQGYAVRIVKGAK